MKKKLTNKEMEIYRKYHVPGCSNLHRIKVNAIFLHLNGSKKHEMRKCELVYDLRKSGSNVITEAVRNKRDENGLPRRVDVVDLTTGTEYEIELTKKRGERFKNEKGVKVIKVGWN